MTYAHGLVNGQCGLTDGSIAGDWRLPNVKEMKSLIDYDFFGPAMHQSYFFSNVQLGIYWSSTTYINYPDSAWAVEMHDGMVGHSSKTNYFNVWPVSGGHPY